MQTLILISILLAGFYYIVFYSSENKLDKKKGGKFKAARLSAADFKEVSNKIRFGELGTVKGGRLVRVMKGGVPYYCKKNKFSLVGSYTFISNSYLTAMEKITKRGGECVGFKNLVTVNL